MDSVPFVKMSGCGNDFIIIDNRRDRFSGMDIARFVSRVCQRKMSVGADGVILVEDSPDADFRWRFFNADGGVAEMCGNGARCVARFAVMAGIAGGRMTFLTDAGPIRAEVTGEQVRIRMTDPVDYRPDNELVLDGEVHRFDFINTGVPHVVVAVEGLDALDVETKGRAIRLDPRFAPAGTNVNFIRVDDPGRLSIRTYERGVEAETLACGTGCVASALVSADRFGFDSPVSLRTRSGGLLTIHFERSETGFGPVHLEGDARLIYRGELAPDAWDYE